MTSRGIGLAALQWTARALAVLLLLLITAVAIGEGVPNPFHFPLRVQIEFAALATMLAGLGIGWRREVVGGVMVFVGLLAFNLVELVVHRHLAGRALPFFAIPAVLYLLHAALARRTLTTLAA